MSTHRSGRSGRSRLKVFEEKLNAPQSGSSVGRLQDGDDEFKSLNDETSMEVEAGPADVVEKSEAASASAPAVSGGDAMDGHRPTEDLHPQTPASACSLRRAETSPNTPAEENKHLQTCSICTTTSSTAYRLIVASDSRALKSSMRN